MKNKIIIYISLAVILIICFIIYFKYSNSNEMYSNNKYNNAAIENTDDSNNIDTSTNNITNSSASEIMDFSLKDINGNNINISDYKGKKVFVNFWATWCPPCNQEIPYINQISKENQDEIKVITVNLGEEKDTVQKYIKQKGYDMTVLLDSNGDVADTYMIYSIPTSYLLDTNGNIVDKHTGTMSMEELKKFMEIK